MNSETFADVLASRIESRSANIGILGLGYVGLPLAMASFDVGFKVTGFDIDAKRVSALAAGKSPISRIPNQKLLDATNSGRVVYTNSSADLAQRVASFRSRTRCSKCFASSTWA